MEIVVEPGEVLGTVAVPSSKSLLQRFMIAALLADGLTELREVRHCRDSLSCLAAIKALGAQATEKSKGTLQIRGCAGKIEPDVRMINCNESGFALRALASVAALAEEEITLTGNGSLLRRPVDFFEKFFPLLDVGCRTNNGFLPLSVDGPMKFRDISIDGGLSSQFLSGLLMVYPLAEKDNTIEVSNLKSRQYIDLTMQVLKDFGISVLNNSYRRFTIPGNQHYKSCVVSMEGDWSAAAFMLVAGAVAGEVTVENLNPNSKQPDRAILDVLKEAGALVSLNAGVVTVKKGKLESFSFDATDCPDLFPSLVALAVQCRGISEITGTERLIYKESNRALALQQEFSKLNEKVISIEGNKMLINGKLKLRSAVVNSHNDHRIAMALAVAALNVEGGIRINGSETVVKSYPDFFADLGKIRNAMTLPQSP